MRRETLPLIVFGALCVANMNCFAKNCHEFPQKLDVKRAGVVYFVYSNPICLKAHGKNNGCSQSGEVDRDYCANPHSVRKYVCSHDKPKLILRACPGGTQCQKGACVSTSE